MHFRTRFGEVVGIDFSQQHRAFDSLGFGQLRGLSLGELKQSPTDSASLRVTVAPPPVLDELTRPLHAFVFDQAGLNLRPGDKESATFLARGQPYPCSRDMRPKAGYLISRVRLIPRDVPRWHGDNSGSRESWGVDEFHCRTSGAWV